MYFYLIISILAALALVKFLGDIIYFIMNDDYGFDKMEKIIAILKFLGLLFLVFGMCYVSYHFIIKYW